MIVGEFEKTVEIIPDKEPVPDKAPSVDESELPHIPETDTEGEGTYGYSN